MIPGSLGTLFANSGVNVNGLILNVDAGNPISYPGTGGIWYDLTSNGYNGTNNGANWTSDGTWNFSPPSFGSQGDLFNFDRAAVEDLTEVTTEVWFKSDAIDNDRGLFCAKSDQDYDGCFSMRYDKVGDKKSQIIRASFGDNSDEADRQTSIQSSAFMQTTDWNCITVTCHLANSIQLYQNGILDTPSKVSISSYWGYIDNPSAVILGRGKESANNSSISPWFDGKIAIFRIYNRVLSAQEVLSNFRAVRGRFGL